MEEEEEGPEEVRVRGSQIVADLVDPGVGLGVKILGVGPSR